MSYTFLLDPVVNRASPELHVKMGPGRLSWTLFSLVSGSHMCVFVSPEEYRMSGFSGDHFSAARVFDANAVFDSGTHWRHLRRLFGRF